MQQNNLRLYVDARFTSPYAMSAFVALYEKALQFEIATVNLATKEQAKPDFASKSLTCRVPVLQHGEFFLSESSAITEYVDEVFEGGDLYPKSPHLRARARQVQAWLRSDLMPLRQERTTLVLFYGAKAQPLSLAGQEAADKLCAVADVLLSQGEEHLFGQWSIVDVDLALMLNRLALHGDPLPPRLAEYASRQWQRPSVRMWVDQTRPPL